MSLNQNLTAAVRNAQAATDKAAQELDRVRRMYEMTDAGITAQRNQLFAAARETADAEKARGLEAIDAAISELDAQEQREGERRAADLAYMQRLESKVRIAQGMGEIDNDSADVDRLKTLFSEFAGDPLAVAVIRQTLGAQKSFFFLPDDASGKAQKHLRETVKPLFVRCMDFAGCDPAAFAANAEMRAAECDSFCAYAAAQDDYFTLVDREVLDALRNDGKTAPGFNLRTMNL